MMRCTCSQKSIQITIQQQTMATVVNNIAQGNGGKCKYKVRDPKETQMAQSPDRNLQARRPFKDIHLRLLKLAHLLPGFQSQPELPGTSWTMWQVAVLESTSDT